jgi:hypothetical protein
MLVDEYKKGFVGIFPVHKGLSKLLKFIGAAFN